MWSCLFKGLFGNTVTFSHFFLYIPLFKAVIKLLAFFFLPVNKYYYLLFFILLQIGRIFAKHFLLSQEHNSLAAVFSGNIYAFFFCQPLSHWDPLSYNACIMSLVVMSRSGYWTNAKGWVALFPTPPAPGNDFEALRCSFVNPASICCLLRCSVQKGVTVTQ